MHDFRAKFKNDLSPYFESGHWYNVYVKQINPCLIFTSEGIDFSESEVMFNFDIMNRVVIKQTKHVGFKIGSN